MATLRLLGSSAYFRRLRRQRRDLFASVVGLASRVPVDPGLDVVPGCRGGGPGLVVLHRAELGGGSGVRRFSAPAPSSVCGRRSQARGAGVAVCGLGWWFGRSSLAGARFATPCRAKALPWLLPGPMTATPLGAVSFLEASLWQCFLLLHSGFSGGNSRSSLDRARVTLLRHFPVGASLWMYRRSEGQVERFGGWCRRASRRRLGGAQPWGWRGGRSGGSGVSPPLCCVEVSGCRLWSLG